MISTKTVVVLGSAYGGARAAQLLAAGIPKEWRILLIDRNSHTNNAYILPRLSVLPGHEHKAFIPNTKVFMTDQPPELHRRLQAHITSFSQKSLTLSQAFPEHGLPTQTVDFDFAIYALGSQLPAPLNLWGTDASGNPIPRKPSKGRQLPIYRGLKTEGIAWLQAHQKLIEESPSVLVVGGGALGIQFATDIATVHPTKPVTLLHSRDRLLPRFDEGMHVGIIQALESISNVDVILGERLDLSSVDEKPGKTNERGQRIVRTVKGREIAADLILLCTGQSPNTELLREMDPSTVNPGDRLAHVLRTMQLGVLPPQDIPTTEKPSRPVGVVVQENQTAHEPVSPESTSELASAVEKIALADAEASNDNGEGTSPSSNDDTQPEEVAVEEPLAKTPYPNIFVIGDAADAFGAIPAGHNAYYQAEIAARNVLHLIKRAEGVEGLEEPLERYQPGLPAIKVSLGLGKSIYQSRGQIGHVSNVPDDLQAASLWPFFGIIITNDDQMYE
ncbi:Apoptosis-inducing factor B [Hypsizygus marmoreus]|uniref:Apoptosis-inducing factor B n=1 Tax=Hypsizygus marmoreus TaxID=39966 RepID=A0A369JK09_HYPMA|nr:Apoptosis-inducing factor B [Hypsizygus marmoreus]